MKPTTKKTLLNDTAIDVFSYYISLCHDSIFASDVSFVSSAEGATAAYDLFACLSEYSEVTAREHRRYTGVKVGE